MFKDNIEKISAASVTRKMVAIGMASVAVLGCSDTKLDTASEPTVTGAAALSEVTTTADLGREGSHISEVDCQGVGSAILTVHEGEVFDEALSKYIAEDLMSQGSLTPIEPEIPEISACVASLEEKNQINALPQDGQYLVPDQIFMSTP